VLTRPSSERIVVLLVHTRSNLLHGLVCLAGVNALPLPQSNRLVKCHDVIELRELLGRRVYIMVDLIGTVCGQFDKRPDFGGKDDAASDALVTSITDTNGSNWTR
jgi:hypothetical protein